MHPGMVFDLTLPLDQVAEGYRAMDERRAIKQEQTYGNQESWLASFRKRAL